MKYTQIPTNTFEQIQLNAGILADSFDPATGEVGRLLGATSGGVSFADSIEYIDFGEDIDNCPKNMLELKKLDSHDVKMSGTFVTMSAETAKMLAAAADVDEENEGHIIPRNDLRTTDFAEVWWIGDYSNENTGEDAGFIAIRLLNALSTGGFQIQSSDKAKGTFSFEFTGHYSMAAQDKVPYEIYVQGGTVEPEPTPVTGSIELSAHELELVVNGTETLTATTVPMEATVTWATSDDTVAAVDGGVVTAVAAGEATITASIEVEGETYTDTCTVIVAEG